ncbi:PTS sugar transporter subunit IIC [Limosilactobacillus sp. STM2_1]|uniref:Permease IIC component n=1 Tax=Limosilactobacillus rudii TaxID=2759755 RepID=A0A7W3UJB0_9LACO|nr:PTS transporter subunit EIIC [Limosilactobacillus rudii]MBB1078512.1 PTS sugar transporter subunit IIC [Limosilactobacillus rudii]MBB1096642.1 PTS sugar transporter subunit IIC [Limosilactobacillus rudii]MCD7134162.1 PTS transporter subunit EIIC [Limosilactobacillus rudii]
MERLINFLVKLYKSKLAYILRHTLRAMFPLILVGSFAAVLRFSFFSTSGYVSTIIDLNRWLPFYRQFGQITKIIFECTINVIAVYAAFFSTHYTVSAYQKNIPGAGAVGLFAYLIIAYQATSQDSLAFNNYLLSQGMLIAIIVGYLCGRLLVLFAKSKEIQLNQIIKPVVIISIIAVIVNMTLGLFVRLSLPTYVASFITINSSVKAFWYVIGLGTLTDVMAIFAIGGPFINSPSFTDAPSWANLMHALRTGSVWNAPFKYTDTTIFHSFANFGGSGCVLALIIAILIVSRETRYRSISKWSLFPAIFNDHYPMMLGIPILYNPIFFIPFVVAPLVNMLISGALLSLNWIPAAVYPVPAGTPAPLIALVGTNGNWGSFILSTCLIIIDVLIYIPFVRVAEEIAKKVGVVDNDD